jgi:hypothetical protein
MNVDTHDKIWHISLNLRGKSGELLIVQLVTWLVGLSQFGNLAMLASRLLVWAGWPVWPQSGLRNITKAWLARKGGKLHECQWPWTVQKMEVF